jgi:hypothetical protein
MRRSPSRRASTAYASKDRSPDFRRGELLWIWPSRLRSDLLLAIRSGTTEPFGPVPPKLHAGYSCGAVADFHRLPEHPSTILCDLCQSRGGTAGLSTKILYLVNQKGLQGVAVRHAWMPLNAASGNSIHSSGSWKMAAPILYLRGTTTTCHNKKHGRCLP